MLRNTRKDVDGDWAVLIVEESIFPRPGIGALANRQETLLATTTNPKAPLHQRALYELKEFVILAVYLYITLGAVVLMKTAVLHAEGIEFAPWGIAVIKAAVLAKFMLLGNAMKIGGRNTTSPLIWPTLHKAFAFLVLLIIMTIIEEAIVGLFHHRSIASSLSELVGPRLEETIAGFLIMLLVLIPFFAFRVLSEALGEGRLERMFFVEREPMERRWGQPGEPQAVDAR
jgi:hypothetical protein